MRGMLITFIYLAVQCINLVEASRTALPGQQPIQASNSTLGILAPFLGFLKKRDDVSTCGFFDGSADKPRTANPGFDCRVDTQRALWGFCPTTVIAASDCGLAGACVDNHACTSGCGILGDSTITTFSCTAKGGDFCSTALLTAGPDQTYAYIACGGEAITDHMLVSPTTTPVSNTPKPTPTPSQTPSPAESSHTTAPPTPPPSSTPDSSTKGSSSSSSDRRTSSPPPTGTGTSELTKPASDISSTITSTSPPDSNTPSSGPNNVGAIVGGVIGGAALICFAILGFLLIRKFKFQREHDPAPLPSPKISGPFNFPNMHGTNNRESTLRGSDKFDQYAKYEVYANPYHRNQQNPRPFTPVELSAYRMTRSPYELP